MAPIARWLLCFACIAVALVTARVASAKADFCQDRAAISLHPPPPVIPARDIRLEPWSVMPCFLVDGLDVDEAAPASPRAPSSNVESMPLADRALAPSQAALPSFKGERTALGESEAFPLPRGHVQGVFHPPRG